MCGGPTDAKFLWQGKAGFPGEVRRAIAQARGRCIPRCIARAAGPGRSLAALGEGEVAQGRGACDETGLSKHARRERPSSREKGANESEIRARSEPTFLSPVGPLPSRRRLAPSAEAHARHRRRRSHGVVSGTGTAQRGSPTVTATASWLHRTVTAPLPISRLRPATKAPLQAKAQRVGRCARLVVLCENMS